MLSSFSEQKRIFVHLRNEELNTIRAGFRGEERANLIRKYLESGACSTTCHFWSLSDKHPPLIPHYIINTTRDIITWLMVTATRHLLQLRPSTSVYQYFISPGSRNYKLKMRIVSQMKIELVQCIRLDNRNVYLIEDGGTLFILNLALIWEKELQIRIDVIWVTNLSDDKQQLCLSNANI